MKLFIASDIHGSAYYCRLMLEAYKSSGADYLVLLGDILYHGPRNDLPANYAPKKVIELLNGIADKLICVRGNCESEVDQMVLNFPITSDTALLYDGEAKLTLFMSHGHKYNPEDLPPLSEKTVFLYGHTHVLKIEEKDGVICLNPGSVSLPKQNNPKSYAIYENGNFEIKSFEGEILANTTV